MRRLAAVLTVNIALFFIVLATLGEQAAAIFAVFQVAGWRLDFYIERKEAR